MAETNEKPIDAAARTRKDLEEIQKGSPAQTGPGEGTGMGTDNGSGWAPIGDRFGEEGIEGDEKRENDTQEHSA